MLYYMYLLKVLKHDLQLYTKYGVKTFVYSRHLNGNISMVLLNRPKCSLIIIPSAMYHNFSFFLSFFPRGSIVLGEPRPSHVGEVSKPSFFDIW
jgi:hypothetical protein